MIGVEEDKKNKVCAEVLKSSRYKLFLELRFLESAIFRLIPEEQRRIFFGSDGEKLYYDRNYLLNRYLGRPDAVACDYLHTIIHCLYQHPFQHLFQTEQYREKYWNLAADIAVTDVLREICISWVSEQLPQECFEIVDYIKEEVPVMSAPHIAGCLEGMFGQRNEFELCGYCFTEIEELFRRDSHVCWNVRKEKGEERRAGGGRGEYVEKSEPEEEWENDKETEDIDDKAGQGSDGETENADVGVEQENVREIEDTNNGARRKRDGNTENAEGEGDRETENIDDEKELENGGESENRAEQRNSGKMKIGERQSNRGKTGNRAEQENSRKTENGVAESTEELGCGMRTAAQVERLSNEWKEAAESVALHAKSFAKGRGSIPGSMLLAIQRLTREQYDYAEFLKRFAVMNECMKVNQDEFDYIYYLYGLRILKKIPLIEPLEYKEEKQIKEFVVAIDTSGSCSGELVQRFLNKTYNVLCQSECFSNEIVLHIVQCDAAVQEDVRIDSLEHLEEYISGMTLRGGGGTDFRPVFDYVDGLCEAGEFKRLCGLIYFTDGYGVFPAQPPDYKTAFVFVEREDDVRVPPWAMRLYLEDV